MSLLTDSHRILWNGALSVVVPTFLIALVKILFMSLKKKTICTWKCKWQRKKETLIGQKYNKGQEEIEITMMSKNLKYT